MNRHGNPENEMKAEASCSIKSQNLINREHTTLQTITDAPTENPKIIHAQLNQDGKEGEQGLRLFCQGAGVTQVVIILKDQQTSPDTPLPNTMAIAGPTDYLTPCAPQYATLDRAPQDTRSNSQVLQPSTCPRCDDHQKQNPPHYCSFPLSNECDNRLDSVHPVNDKLSDLALNKEVLTKHASYITSADYTYPKVQCDDYMYSSID